MHHNKAGRQLSRNTSHRKAMFRNMVDSLMEYERIETTLPKAKELRKYADRVITLGKKGTLAARRRALNMMRRREMVGKVFDQLTERFQGRNGGYTRILRLGPRAGDQTQMALVELVGSFGESSAEKGEKKTKKKSKKSTKSASAGEDKKPAKKAAASKKETAKETAKNTKTTKKKTSQKKEKN